MKHKEDILQEQCVTWFRLKYPKKIIFSIPNGGSRRLLEAVRLKRQGVLKGVPDLLIPEPVEPYCGMFIELKVKPNKPTKEQTEFLQNMAKKGYMAGVCYTFERFQEVVDFYFLRIAPKQLKVPIEYQKQIEEMKL